MEEVGPQAIEPVLDCESDLPLPSDAARLVGLPGLIALESATSADEVVAFYQAALQAAEWEPSEESQADGVILLLYARDEEMLGDASLNNVIGLHMEVR